jgi:hypothetical protein
MSFVKFVSVETELLYGRLAEALVRLTADRIKNPQPIRTASPGNMQPVRAKFGDTSHGQAHTEFTKAGHALAELGIVEITDGVGRCIEWRYLIDGNKASDFVSERLKSKVSNTPELDSVILAWILCAEFFGMITSRRSPFNPHDDMLPLMELMVHNGYAEKLGQQYLWSDKIGTAMRAADNWNSDNLSFIEVEEREVEADLREALKTAPELVRIAALRKDELTVQAALCNLWVDGQWIQLAEDRKISLFGGIERARRFIELVTEDKTSSKSKNM